MREREYSVKGRYPWVSIDACSMQMWSFLNDSAKDIKECLTCTKARCNNCKGEGTCRLASRKTGKNLTVFETLVQEHKTRQQICAELNISKSTYYNYLNACGAIASA